MKAKILPVLLAAMLVMTGCGDGGTNSSSSGTGTDFGSTSSSEGTSQAESSAVALEPDAVLEHYLSLYTNPDERESASAEVEKESLDKLVEHLKTLPAEQAQNLLNDKEVVYMMLGGRYWITDEPTVKVNFDVDGIKFSMLLPESWTVDGNKIFKNDTLKIEVLPCRADSEDNTLQNLSSEFKDAVVTSDITVGSMKGKYFHMQSTPEGSTEIENQLLYFVDSGDNLINIVLYPLRGVGGISAQQEEFEGILDTLILE